jgi:GMP synthase-like glutamine amidotransferase
MNNLEEIPSLIELAYKNELERKINPEEREFLQAEVERSRRHHEHMNSIVESLEILKEKPILLVNAADKATMGQDWIANLDQELLNYFVKIQTGREYIKSEFDYKKFVGQIFEYMFGFKPDDQRFKQTSLVHGDTLPADPSKFSLIIGTGGEINDFETQPQYEKTRADIRDFFSKVIDADVPFTVTCATHQILGQLLYEKKGGQGSLVQNLKNAKGEYVTESGLVQFTLNEANRKSFFTTDLDSKFNIMSNHGQYLQDLPPDAQSLAYNNICSTQIIEYIKNNQTYGIGFQAHPEISNAVLMLAQRHERAQAVKQGVTPSTDIKLDTSSAYLVRDNVFPKIFSLIKSANKENY